MRRLDALASNVKSRGGVGQAANDTSTNQTRARYNRLAAVYDLHEAIVERLAFRGWRQKLWSQVRGDHVLEVGVGTGKNMPYYSRAKRVTAIDLSERMLQRAQQRADRMGIEVDLRVMDVQELNFPDASFDGAVATFVFCSVPDPVLGLRELGRVLRPGGQLLLLEHVRVNTPIVGALMDLLDPLVLRVMGPHINRRTVENVSKAGLQIAGVEELSPGGLFKLIRARDGL